MGKSKKLISLILIFALMLSPVQVSSAESRTMTEEQVMHIAREIGEKYHICPELLASIAFKESTYNPSAEYDGCVGLMQVSPKWHKERMKSIGVSDLMDPYENMLVAADYLLELFEKYEDLGMVLMVYNGDSEAETYWSGKSDLSEYAMDIIEMSESLERKYEE